MARVVGRKRAAVTAPEAPAQGSFVPDRALLLALEQELEIIARRGSSSRAGMSSVEEVEEEEAGNGGAEEEEEEDGEKYLVGFVEVSVVGLQYYEGTVNDREMVRLIREPHNPYDGNAIRVENMRGEQVGHVERFKALYLAPLLDQGSVALEGIVPRGSKNPFRMPCQVYVFASPPSLQPTLLSLRRCGLSVVTPDDPQFERASAMAAAPAGKALDSQAQKRSLDEIFDSLATCPGNAGFMEPSPLITTRLYPHQKEALAWLVKRENSTDLPPFWQVQPAQRGANVSYVNTLTNFMTNQPPESFRGGILADEMGLGKTLTLLSLIASNKPGAPLALGGKAQASSGEGENALRKPPKRRKGDARGQKDVPEAKGGPWATLIVCPLSVLSNWVSQLEEHTVPGCMRVHLYHGPERIKSARTLGNFDIVLTTYNILATEGDGRLSPLQRVQWLRIILDEAHLVKSPGARQTKAAVALNAERRWAVTGTPIQNSAKDLYSLMMFLKLQPLNERSFWNRTIERPLLSGDANGFSRLQALMMTIALRRTKDMQIDGKRLVNLPRKTVSIFPVELSLEDRQLYDKVEWEGKQLVGQYVASGTILQNYTTVLQIIMRLRQICDHSSLCPLQEGLLTATASLGDMSSHPQLLQKLLSVLQSGDEFDCPICLSPPVTAVITSCAHVFCRRCIEKTLMHDKQQCPMCRFSLTPSDLFTSPPTEAGTGEQVGIEKDCGTSAKIQALIKLLNELKEKDPTAKSVVFSQFSRMLNLVQGPLESAGFHYARLDGSMSSKKREMALKAFMSTEPSSPTVFLLSLKAAGLGLNLVAASQVFMLDPWWNPAVEEQAMDRVHRLGQRRDVQIVRLIVTDSIEERILEMQEKKRTLATFAFEKSVEHQRQMRVEDVQLLMQL